MAEFIDVTELKEKMCDSASNGNQVDNNGVDKTEQFEKNGHTSDRELSELFQEKKHLHEKGKELKKLVSNILEENLEVDEKSDVENMKKNEKEVAVLIRCRLSEIYAHCKKLRSIFERFLDNNRNKLQNVHLFKGKDHVEFKQKLELADSMFSAFNEQVSRIELLMKPDYDSLCHESLDCVNFVMSECGKMEDNCNSLISVLFEK